MPITNHAQLVRFSEMCGAEIPRWIRLRLAEFGDDQASIRAFGIDVVGELCQTLLDNGAPGLHFYTLNHAQAPLAIWRELDIPGVCLPPRGNQAREGIADLSLILAPRTPLPRGGVGGAARKWLGC